MATPIPLLNHSVLHAASYAPLGLAAIAHFLDPASGWGWHVVFTYGVGLLFLSIGVRFGMHYGRFRQLVWHQKLVVLSPLIGLAAILVDGKAALGFLVFGFGAQGAIDAWGGHVGVVPDRYVSARLLATTLIVCTLIVLILFG